MKLANTFKVGCDPEFVFLDGRNRQITADMLLPVQTKSIRYGSIGTDLGGVCELRPSANKSTYALTANLRWLITTLAAGVEFMPLTWRAGASIRTQYNIRVEIGGHIHFERTKQPVWWKNGKAIRGADVDYEANLLPVGRALIELAVKLEELGIHPQQEAVLRARPGHYGDSALAFRSGRPKPTIEFRKMCSWLWHPKVAFASLTLAKLVVCNPDHALDVLHGQVNFAQLRALVRPFVDADDDAARLDSSLLSKGISALRCDHTQNFLPYWKAWTPKEGTDNLCAE